MNSQRFPNIFCSITDRQVAHNNPWLKMFGSGYKLKLGNKGGWWGRWRLRFDTLVNNFFFLSKISQK